jgi:hypothetical protein
MSNGRCPCEGTAQPVMPNLEQDWERLYHYSGGITFNMESQHLSVVSRIFLAESEIKE